jgi:hypothetical protein
VEHTLGLLIRNWRRPWLASLKLLSKDERDREVDGREAEINLRKIGIKVNSSPPLGRSYWLRGDIRS